MKINHTARFLNGAMYSLDNDGIDTMLTRVKEQFGETVYAQAKDSLVKEIDPHASTDDLIVYSVTCTRSTAQTNESKRKSEHKSKLRQIRNRTEPVIDGTSNAVVTFEVHKDDFHWLMQQAEEIEQVKAAYDDRVGDAKSLEALIVKIKEAYESDDENQLDEMLHGLFTNEIDDIY